MQVKPMRLPGVQLIVPRIFGDERGSFAEVWHSAGYGKMGVPASGESFVQDNLSVSRKGVLRGLHLQHPNGQGKLVSVLSGRIFDVVADVRLDSPTYGEWLGVHLDGVSRHQLYVPSGYAHGFLALEDDTVVQYKCTAFYSPGDELSVIWNDPTLGIDWPISDPIQSVKDAAASKLTEIDPARLPTLASSVPLTPVELQTA
ncbi:MAG: dTDP-4-dehydrorhamnose 3,5-epimerase [Bradymonadia bacterium]